MQGVYRHFFDYTFLAKHVIMNHEEGIKVIVYKSILEKLKTAGFTTYALMKGGIISQGALTKIRRNEPVSLGTINTICKLTKLQPGDLLEYVDDES